MDEGKVSEIVVTEKHIRGIFKTAQPDGKKSYATARVESDPSDKLVKNDVKAVGGTDETLLKSLFSWLFPMLIFLGV